MLICCCVAERLGSSSGGSLSLLQTRDSCADCDGSGSGKHVRSSSHSLLAPCAVPNTGSLTLHRVLSAEGADVPAVLGHLHLLDDLSQGSTVPGAVLANDSSLLSVISLKSQKK